ncbi:MAG TPA: outer membrane beta-barrel protein [Gemmatimonadaceae bacterium]|nr:outer membrane beta-barrel protein [Gemmatimonadaceae bacterium]
MERPIRSALVVAALLAGAATSSSAQSAGDGYLFHSPNVTLTVRGGYSLANARSDVFDDVTRDLTLDRGDFSGFTVGGDLNAHMTDRLDVVFSAGFSRSKHKSEFRDFVDNNDQPIEQTTTFERVPVTANLRLNLAAPGRTIGHLAWVPSRIVPYVGAGIGAMRYRFKQEGDFVNFVTNGVFPAVLLAEEWTLVGQGMAGLDYNVSPQLGISFDARYLHARGDLGPSFKGYERIDLSGVTATVGLSVRL